MLVGVKPIREALTAEEIDTDLLDSPDTKDLVGAMLRKAVSLKIDDVRTVDGILSFHVEFDSIGAGTFRGKIYPIPAHHEVHIRIPTGDGHRIAFVFGRSFSAHVAKGRLNRVLAKRGAFVDLPLTEENLRHILQSDSTEITGNALKGVRTRYRSTFQGARVDNGMADYIRRARGEGGRDDWVSFVSRALGREIRISLSRSTLSVSLPLGAEDTLIDYVLNVILPALR
jgi:hypothetical protein